jgi:hypothetical protein
MIIFLEKILKNKVFKGYMKQIETLFVPKIPLCFSCKCCDYNTSSKKDYNKHIQTQKHKNETNETKKSQKSPNDNKIYQCLCGIVFYSRTTLWRHKKKCQTNNNNNNNNNTQLMEYLMKENLEFKQIFLTSLQEQNKNIIEIAKNIGNNNNNNITNNQHFNLQFYLNNTCKNAMNIMDFVGQLNVGISDLEETGRLGFAEGISKIFINGLNQININDRPIHCSDSKRETIYIKNNNEWTKEGDDKTLLTNAIKHVANKNIKQIFEWTKEHPEFNGPSSKENDKYLKIVSESMCGSTKEETNKNYNKIIKNIVKETIIDKI